MAAVQVSKHKNKTKTMGLDEIWDDHCDSDCVYVTKNVWIVCRWTLFQQLFPVTKTSTVKRITSLLTVSCNIPNGFITLLSATESEYDLHFALSNESLFMGWF